MLYLEPFPVAVKAVQQPGWELQVHGIAWVDRFMDINLGTEGALSMSQV
jgi:hypothetical protein